MQLSISLVCLVLGAGACVSPGAAAARSIAGSIDRYDELAKEDRDALVAGLSGKSWKRMSPDQRLDVQKACFKRSEQLLGRHAQGKIKVVKDEGEKAILRIAGRYLHSLSPRETPAHAAAGDLFGEIPTDAPRVSRVVEIDPSVVRWQSTGLYAAPGEVVTLEFPEAWIRKGVHVQVSGHRDGISVKKSLMRLPTSPARRFPVDGESVEVAAAFGGALYVDLGNQPREGEAFELKVSNALAAPYFVLGETKVEDWRNTLQQAPAPYAELVSDRIALSFPSAWIRDLDDPTELMEYWDQVVALHDELGGMDSIRRGPERVNVDVQISVGLFHAGYPAQGPQKQCRGVVDLEKLKTRGNWGWFHELGHESQRRPDKAWGWNNPYTFDGSVEVTVNLFSAHAMDRMEMANRGGWSWTASSKEVAERAHKTLSGPKRYPELGAGEKLAMYLQLRDQFGWTSIQKVLAGYSRDQDANPDLLPKENQAKRDAFLVRMSRSTGHNLTPFLQDLWGIKMSPEAIAQVKELPVWMPEGYGKYLES